jgi:hypothetical protein
MAFNNRKNLLFAGLILLLAGVAAAAWIHSSDSAPAPVVVTQPSAASPEPVTKISNPGDGYYPSIPPPIYVRQAEAPPPEPVYESAPVTHRTYRTYRERRRHHGRSKKHSIEIVAGTAAAGAAIGAIAGGGPGAAIGAISGGGAGFVYDRLTHKH